MTLKWILRIMILLLCSMIVRPAIIQPVLDYKLRSIVQSKIKEGQTFKEWFLYTRFRKYIPPLMIVWYFANFVFCIVTAVISTVWVLITGDNETITEVNNIFIAISGLPTCGFYILFYCKGERGVSDVVDRDKRYYKKKKKHPLQKKK